MHLISIGEFLYLKQIFFTKHLSNTEGGVMKKNVAFLFIRQKPLAYFASKCFDHPKAEENRR